MNELKVALNFNLSWITRIISFFAVFGGVFMVYYNAKFSIGMSSVDLLFVYLIGWGLSSMIMLCSLSFVDFFDWRERGLYIFNYGSVVGDPWAHFFAALISFIIGFSGSMYSGFLPLGLDYNL